MVAGYNGGNHQFKLGGIMAATNPAKRLLSHLRRFRDKQGNPDVRANELWSDIFRCDKDDVETIYSKLASLSQLTVDLEREVLERGGKKEVYLADLPAIRKGLKQRAFQTTISAAKSFFTEGAITRLEFCSELLSTAEEENEIVETTLADLKAQIDAFYESVLGSTVSPFLRRVLLELAETARRSIADYEIHGVKQLRSTYYQMLGIIVANKKELEKEENGVVWQSMITVGNGLARAVEIAANVATLIGFSVDKVPPLLP